VIRARPVSRVAAFPPGLVTAVRRLRAPTADNLLYLPALFAASDPTWRCCGGAGPPAAAPRRRRCAATCWSCSRRWGRWCPWRRCATNNAVERALRRRCCGGSGRWAVQRGGLSIRGAVADGDTDPAPERQRVLHYLDEAPLAQRAGLPPRSTHGRMNGYRGTTSVGWTSPCRTRARPHRSPPDHENVSRRRRISMSNQRPRLLQGGAGRSQGALGSRRTSPRPASRPRLRALVELRVSQINGCRLLRGPALAGGTPGGRGPAAARLPAGVAGDAVFDDRERAALAWPSR